MQRMAMNFGFDLGADTSVYSFATYGEKRARAFENYRMPSRVPLAYPLGFSPLETFDETDFALTAGIKGSLGGWKWDLSSTYGKDVTKIGVDTSVNVSLLRAIWMMGTLVALYCAIKGGVIPGGIYLRSV